MAFNGELEKSEKFISLINLINEIFKKEFKEINIPFRCNIRADLVDKEIIELLKKANVKAINPLQRRLWTWDTEKTGKNISGEHR